MKIPSRKNLHFDIEIMMTQKLSESIREEIDSVILNEIKRKANEEK